MEHIVYKWLDTPVQFEKKLELPQFRLVNFTLEDCSQNYTTGKLQSNLCITVDILQLHVDKHLWLIFADVRNIEFVLYF